MYTDYQRKYKAMKSELQQQIGQKDEMIGDLATRVQKQEKTISEKSDQILALSKTLNEFVIETKNNTGSLSGLARSILPQIRKMGDFPKTVQRKVQIAFQKEKFDFLNTKVDQKLIEIERLGDLVYLLSQKVKQAREMKRENKNSRKETSLTSELNFRITQLEKSNQAILRDNMAFEAENLRLKEELQFVKCEKNEQLDRMQQDFDALGNKLRVANNLLSSRDRRADSCVSQNAVIDISSVNKGKGD